MKFPHPKIVAHNLYLHAVLNINTVFNFKYFVPKVVSVDAIRCVHVLGGQKTALTQEGRERGTEI